MKVLNKILLSFIIAALIFAGTGVRAQDAATQNEFTQFEESVHDTIPVEIRVNDGQTVTKVIVAEESVESIRDEEEVDIKAPFFINLAINLVTVILIIFLIYFPNNRRREYIFTFMLFNVIIFLLTYILNEVKISMGAAFGLFAVFSMLRYRTAGISMKDMTYLFIFIALGLLSAIHLEYYENIAINAIILIMTFVLDSRLFFKRFNTKRIDYDNTDLIKPQNREQLIEDLKERTGLNIYDVTVGRIDFLKDSANVKIYYND